MEGEKLGGRDGKRPKSRRKNTVRRGRIFRTIAFGEFSDYQPLNNNKAVISNNTSIEYTFLSCTNQSGSL